MRFIRTNKPIRIRQKRVPVNWAPILGANINYCVPELIEWELNLWIEHDNQYFESQTENTARMRSGWSVLMIFGKQILGNFKCVLLKFLLVKNYLVLVLNSVFDSQLIWINFRFNLVRFPFFLSDWYQLTQQFPHIVNDFGSDRRFETNSFFLFYC